MRSLNWCVQVVHVSDAISGVMVEGKQPYSRNGLVRIFYSQHSITQCDGIKLERKKFERILKAIEKNYGNYQEKDYSALGFGSRFPHKILNPPLVASTSFRKNDYHGNYPESISRD
ncbi:hypothetical protein HELRODRAFT_176462 [Helobdella robusta]|uniref:Uncharacterized protein n=1 Tax=Helobdella robusta TaxID=6412 RepID=T1FAJ1_HELRO|nr:hypothetical protein HELRODRAFT_176462 [Helobdella robusta]ESN99700.1 hypothetical protein HELRODRAFT_176462 [Helobdella robusta]